MVGGVRCVVRGVEGCGRDRGMWWEGWSVVGGVRCVVGGVKCGGRGKVCGERGGGVWEG